MEKLALTLTQMSGCCMKAEEGQQKNAFSFTF